MSENFLVSLEKIPVVEDKTACLYTLFKPYFDTLVVLGRSEMYIRNLKCFFKKLLAFTGWRFPADISLASFERFRYAYRTLSPKTLNNYLISIRSFISWLIDRGILDNNPLIHCRTIRAMEVRHRRALTVEEVCKLISVSPPERAIVYRFAYFTGLRRKEIFSLVWDDLTIDNDTPFVLVRSCVSKNRKQQTIPLRGDLAEMLRSVRPLRFRGGQKVFRKIYKQDLTDFRKAGIVRLAPDGVKADFHSIRKSFCTSLFTSGVNPRVVQELMRHSDFKLTTAIYTDPVMLPLREGVEKMPPL